MGGMQKVTDLDSPVCLHPQSSPACHYQHLPILNHCFPSSWLGHFSPFEKVFLSVDKRDLTDLPLVRGFSLKLEI